MAMYVLHLFYSKTGPFLKHKLSQDFNMTNWMSATNEAGSTYLSWALGITLTFLVGLILHNLQIVLCQPLFGKGEKGGEFTNC